MDSNQVDKKIFGEDDKYFPFVNIPNEIIKDAFISRPEG